MAIICCELKWLHSLLTDLRVPLASPTPLSCDNQAALYIASSLVFNEWTKHIEINCHFIRDEFQANLIVLTYLPCETQPADTFTKALGSS